jgi:putative transcriptional regulator
MKDHRFLAKQRNTFGMTQEEVSALARIDRSYYTKIEKGAVPSVKVAKRLADVLKFDWTCFYT